MNFGAVDAAARGPRAACCWPGFALIYGADWLLVPLEAPIGTRRADHPARRARHVRAHDHGRPDRARRRVGHVRPLARGRPDRRAPCCSRPRSPRAVQGRDLEEVLLLRDEAANLAWAVERTHRGRGRPPRRPRAGGLRGGPARGRRQRPPARCPTACAPTRRRTGSRCIPQRAQPTDPSMSFRLGAIPRVQPGVPATPLRPRGRLLAPMVRTRRSRSARTRSRARAPARHAPTSSHAGSTAPPCSGSAGARASGAARAPAACASTPPSPPSVRRCAWPPASTAPSRNTSWPSATSHRCTSPASAASALEWLTNTLATTPPLHHRRGDPPWRPRVCASTPTASSPACVEESAEGDAGYIRALGLRRTRFAAGGTSPLDAGAPVERSGAPLAGRIGTLSEARPTPREVRLAPARHGCDRPGFRRLSRVIRRPRQRSNAARSAPSSRPSVVASTRPCGGPTQAR